MTPNPASHLNRKNSYLPGKRVTKRLSTRKIITKHPYRDFLSVFYSLSTLSLTDVFPLIR